ncbi:MAG TPA: hypothetical protein VNO21_17655, partial [Polyangiaceae bacterium]|nr:hypothetical protein [Polyangiaceae bacterium]
MDTKAFLVLVAFLLSTEFGCGSTQPTGTAAPPSEDRARQAAPVTDGSTPQFVYCAPAKFANCTIAPCEPAKGGYTCKCFVDTRYSATSYDSTCLPPNGNTLQSRYHPVTSYQECTSPSADTSKWAWCLGKTCTVATEVDSGVGRTTALCDCTVPPPHVSTFPYIVVTPTFSAGACTLGQTGKY